MTAKIIYMGCTIDYLIKLGREAELLPVLTNCVFKDFDSMVKGGSVINIHYVLLKNPDENPDDKDNPDGDGDGNGDNVPEDPLTKRRRK